MNRKSVDRAATRLGQINDEVQQVKDDIWGSIFRFNCTVLLQSESVLPVSFFPEMS